jgi:hypothetical protein
MQGLDECRCVASGKDGDVVFRYQIVLVETAGATPAMLFIIVVDDARSGCETTGIRHVQVLR